MEEVRNWLRGLELEQYASKFEEYGWDSVEILHLMSSEDIRMCIDKPGHQKKFEWGLKTRPPETDAVTLTEKDKTTFDVLKANLETGRESGKRVKDISKATLALTGSSDEESTYRKHNRHFDSPIKDDEKLAVSMSAEKVLSIPEKFEKDNSNWQPHYNHGNADDSKETESNTVARKITTSLEARQDRKFESMAYDDDYQTHEKFEGKVETRTTISFGGVKETKHFQGARNKLFVNSRMPHVYEDDEENCSERKSHSVADTTKREGIQE